MKLSDLLSESIAETPAGVSREELSDIRLSVEAALLRMSEGSSGIARKLATMSESQRRRLADALIESVPEGQRTIRGYERAIAARLSESTLFPGNINHLFEAVMEDKKKGDDDEEDDDDDPDDDEEDDEDEDDLAEGRFSGMKMVVVAGKPIGIWDEAVAEKKAAELRKKRDSLGSKVRIETAFKREGSGRVKVLKDDEIEALLSA